MLAWRFFFTRVSNFFLALLFACGYTHSVREFRLNPTLYFSTMPPVGNVTLRKHLGSSLEIDRHQ